MSKERRLQLMVEGLALDTSKAASTHSNRGQAECEHRLQNLMHQALEHLDSSFCGLLFSQCKRKQGLQLGVRRGKFEGLEEDQ